MERILLLVLFMVVSTNAEGLGCNVPRSCADLRAAGFTASGEFMIDPDGKNNGEEPFLVECDLEKGVTIVHHDKEQRNQKVKGPDKEAPGSLQVPITYTPSIDQIKGLVGLSGDCTQNLQYTCTRAAIYKNDEQMTWWTNRNGEKMANWGGATSGVTGCACSADGKECKGGGRCNCNGEGVAKDGGLLSDEDALPVTSVYIGGLGAGQSAKFTVGPLKCDGGPTQTEPEPHARESPGDSEYICTLPPLNGMRRFEFEVRADSGGARLSLRPEENSPEMIELAIDVLGEDGTLQTEIRRTAGGDAICPPVKNENNIPRLTPNVFNGFWCSFDQGQLECGQMNEASQGKPFISEPIPEDLAWLPDFLCYTTDDNQPGYWKFPSFYTEEIIKCEHKKANIDCGDRFVDIHYAYYGRTDKSTCPAKKRLMKDTDCRADTSMETVGKRCQGKQKCKVEAKNGAFGDPCRGTFKYLRIKYKCTDIPVPKTFATGPCRDNPCAPGSTCVAKKNGKYECLCREQQEWQNCDEGQSMCKASGDPHYTDFNGRKFDFQGDCTYVLARPVGENPPWEVHAKNKPPSAKKKVTKTYKVTVIIGDQTVVFSQNKEIEINGEECMTPVDSEATDGAFEILPDGKFVMLESEIHGFKVKWDGKAKVEVIVSNRWAGKLQGLCGPSDGDTSNNFKTSKGVTVPKRDINVFGSSWGVGEECGGKPVVAAECKKDSPQDKLARERCAYLDRENTGPFGEAIRVMSEKEEKSDTLENFRKACWYDVCTGVTGGDNPEDTKETKSLRCKAMGDAAQYINGDSAGFFIDDWEEQCDCPDEKACEEEHTTWSEMVNPCPEVCGGLSPRQQRRCGKRLGHTEPGCECDEGFVLQGAKCVKEEECGCRKQGITRAAGDEFFTKKCKKKCLCIAGGSLECTKVKKGSEDAKACKKGRGRKPGKKGSSSSKSSKKGRGSKQRGSKKSKGSVKRGSKKGSGSGKRGSKKGKGSVKRGSKKGKGSGKRGSKKGSGSGKRGSKKSKGSVKRGSKKGSGSGKRGSKKSKGSGKRGSKKSKGSVKRGSKKGSGSGKRGSKKGSGSGKRGSKKSKGSVKRGSKKGSGSGKRGSKKGSGSGKRGSKKSKGSVKRGSKKGSGSGKRGSKKGKGSVKHGSKKGSGSKKHGSKKGSGSVKRGSKKGSGSGKRGSKKGSGSVKRGSKKGSGSKKHGSKKGSGSKKHGSKKGSGSVKRGSKKGSGSKKHGSKKGSGSVKRGSKKGSGSGKHGSKKGSGSGKRGSKKGSGSGKRGSKKGSGSVKRGSKKGSGSKKMVVKKAVALKNMVVKKAVALKIMEVKRAVALKIMEVKKAVALKNMVAMVAKKAVALIKMVAMVAKKAVALVNMVAMGAKKAVALVNMVVKMAVENMEVKQAENLEALEAGAFKLTPFFRTRYDMAHSI
ncbi:uncharacterized protein [Amphiura filiformis]|uniref:uncharacterized protein isoform X2 n=1 Tax=Amphiura filiformis TaxID=82378 RepID=UPI003B21846D